MAITSFSDLKTQMSNTLDRPNLEPYFDTLISLAESYLSTDPRLMVREAEVEVALTPASGVVTLPADFGGFREAWAKTSPVASLDLVPPDVIRNEFPSNTGSYPQVCSIVGSNMTIRPSTTADVGLIYYRKPAALSVSTTTNWLLDAFPHVYVMASLLQVEVFDKNDERLNVWGSLLDAALGRIKDADMLQRAGRTRSRVRGPTP